jgi:hypothetical protein
MHSKVYLHIYFNSALWLGLWATKHVFLTIKLVFRGLVCIAYSYVNDNLTLTQYPGVVISYNSTREIQDLLSKLKVFKSYKRKKKSVRIDVLCIEVYTSCINSMVYYLSLLI